MRDHDGFDAPSAPLTSDATETSEEDTELTAHEYARECGLCTDYLTETPWDLFRSWEPFETSAEDLENPEDAAQHRVTADDLARERLDINLEARELLFSIVKDEGDSFLHCLPEFERLSNDLRLELPLLETGDHDLDVLHFGHRPVPDFVKMNMPMEYTEREKDEGTEWPTKYRDLPQQVERKYAAEKLEFPREGVEFLMGVMKDEWTAADMDELYASEMTYTKNKALEPITPPLLPLSPPLTPFEPDVDAAELELLSESTAPGAAEAEAMNARLNKLDSILAPGAHASDEVSFSNTDDLTNLYSPLLSVLGSSPYSPPRKRRVEDLRVEVPLTPQNPSSSSPAKKVKRVTFPEMLHEYLPDAPTLEDASQPMRNSDESMEAFFNEFIEPVAFEATRALEQEQLQEADSLYRITVPIVDFTSLIPPWKVYSRKSNGKDGVGVTELDLQRRLLRDVKRDNLKHFPTWSGGSKIERQLPWSPFQPELGNVELEPGISITTDDKAAQYLQRIMDFMSLEDVVTSDNLIWKPDGLRILDDLNESEDDLEEMEIEEPEANDMESLLRKRRRELEDEQPTGAHRPAQRPFEISVRSRDGPPTLIEKPLPETSNRRPDISSTRLNAAVPRIEKLRAQGLDRSGPLMTTPSLPQENIGSAVQPLAKDLGLFGTTFSAATALSSFMQNMGKASTKPETAIPKAAPAPKAPIPAPTSVANPPPESYIAPAQSFPFPPVAENPPPAFFILSSTLLQDKRSLVRSIGKQLPNANCVERDFATLPEANEADILISPATGLMLTTIQKIKQKTLPGQRIQLSGVRERVMKLSLRYERLIVLISEGAAVGGSARIMDERDCEALSEFNGFAAGVAADVMVTFVPGGEEELVKWVAGCMVKYCLTHVRGEKISLLADETLWEQFLRRVGLNAFAAQLVLTDLKDISDPDIQMGEASSSEINTSMSGRSDFGIRAFIRMDPQDRIQRFESLLGGRRVLGRVHRVLEQKWLSAANGFRQPTQL
ncbi:hypothetical protein EG328_008847 [Venturia inaequalis]|uniref:Uncharacterized protein n=1 Tax=Venturia inaequalis TaxID=5025 RepID=A0A8H3V9B0_VENIN|nr:hypothetical protein EG328_008847 [Venturia inaequalis]KAE9991388.1 hypothetical protein EG327_011765 [Venturia inaequalis]